MNEPEIVNVVLTDWQRLCSGCFGLKEGEILKAYSASRLPKVKVFIHDGQPFTCLSYQGGFFEPEANCFPLIKPEAYQGRPESAAYYNGMPVDWNGTRYILGAKVRFVAAEPSVEQCIAILRAAYLFMCVEKIRPIKEALKIMFGQAVITSNWDEASFRLIEIGSKREDGRLFEGVEEPEPAKPEAKAAPAKQLEMF